MIRPLRRAHRLVMTTLAILLPLLVAIALAARHRWSPTPVWPPVPAGVSAADR